MSFEGIALKLSVTCPSLPSLATEDWKQFQCLNMALNNFWTSIDARNILAFQKYSRWHDKVPFRDGAVMRYIFTGSVT